MPRSVRILGLLATLCVLPLLGGHAAAQQPALNLTPGQQVLSKYLLPSASIPRGLQAQGVSALDNVVVAAFATDPSEIKKIATRARLDGLEQDFATAAAQGPQIQVQLSLYKDYAGADADVADPSLLAGLALTTAVGPTLGDTSAIYTTKGNNLESINIVFASGRIEVLVSEVGQPGSVSQADIIAISRLLESRAKAPPPPPSPDELAVLQTQTSPEAILHAAYSLLLEMYLQKLPPSQLLGTAAAGAIKSLVTEGASSLPAPPTITSDDEDAAWAQFLPAFQQMEKLAPPSLTAQALAYAAATEMYNNLNCHTSFFTPRFYSREISSLKGSDEARIGILLEKVQGTSYTILRVEPNSPAERAGLKAGDEILAVDQKTPEQQGEHFTDLFVGQAGTPITLTIRRNGQERPLDITVVRELIKTIVERHRVLPGGIGYIEFNDFTDGDQATTDIRRALQEFQDANVSGWILDLRYNGGGSEQTLEHIAGLFVPAGSLLITDTQQDGTVSTGKAIGPLFSAQKPMALLIGKDTASAAEILTQSLKDLGRVTLVGEPTSGCVNGGLPLGLLDGSGVFVSTIDVRSGPNKVQLENIGVQPDVSVNLGLSDIQSGTDPVLSAALALFGGTPPPAQPAVPSSTRPALRLAIGVRR